jgi:CubicO group peptidase (beta-lactamase class C family)
MPASWQQPAPYIDMSVPHAAGALYSTIADLSRWDDALMGGGPLIVRPATVQEMFRPRIQVVPGDPGEGWYGYGWFIDENRTEYDHDGSINGFASTNAIFLGADAEVIILSNLQTADSRTITDRLAAMIGLHAR